MATTHAAFEGNSHIGLFAKASEDFALIPQGSHKKFEAAAHALGCKIERATIAGSNLLGLFCALNSSGIVLPSFTEEHEKHFFKKLGLNVLALPPQFCAVGNNVCANDRGAIVNLEMPHTLVKKISDCLGVEAAHASIAGHSTVGSACIATNKGFAAHNRIKEGELEHIKSVLKVGGSNATVNMGSPFVGLGVVANSRGCMLGEATSGFEGSRIMNALELG